MKTQNQVVREMVKDTAECFSMIGNEKKIVSDGLDLSKYEDDRMPDGYILMHTECVDSINDNSARKLAKSLSIKQLIKTSAECVQALLGLSKAKVKDNNIFTAIETKNGCSQVVMFWKRR